MSTVENVIEDLRALTPAQLEAAAKIVHRLRETSPEQRKLALAKTAGALDAADGDTMEQALSDCRRPDAR